MWYQSNFHTCGQGPGQDWGFENCLELKNKSLLVALTIGSTYSTQQGQSSYLLCCDLLAWILVTKLVPTYYITLDNLLTSNRHYYKLCSWRKKFKKTWRNLETHEMTMSLNDVYKPDPK